MPRSAQYHIARRVAFARSDEAPVIFVPRITSSTARDPSETMMSVSIWRAWRVWRSSRSRALDDAQRVARSG